MKITISLLVLLIFIVAGGYFLQSHQNAQETSVDSHVSTSTQAATTSTTTSSYTLAQIATHSNTKSCWAAINGNVYDLTTWISQHPGGEARILSICGKDGSSMFNGQHGTDTRAQSVLASFKIGTLSN